MSRLTNQDGVASVVMIEEAKLSDKVVRSRVLMVVERDVIRNGVDGWCGADDGDVRVDCFDSFGEHGKTVSRVTGIAAT